MSAEEQHARHPVNVLCKELSVLNLPCFIQHLDISEQGMSDVSGVGELLKNLKKMSFLERLILRGN